MFVLQLLLQFFEHDEFSFQAFCLIFFNCFFVSGCPAFQKRFFLPRIWLFACVFFGCFFVSCGPSHSSFSLLSAGTREYGGFFPFQTFLLVRVFHVLVRLRFRVFLFLPQLLTLIISTLSLSSSNFLCWSSASRLFCSASNSILQQVPFEFFTNLSSECFQLGVVRILFFDFFMNLISECFDSSSMKCF